MPFPKLNVGSSSGLLDGIKSKLGFPANSAYPSSGQGGYSSKGAYNNSYDEGLEEEFDDDFIDEEDPAYTTSFNNNSTVTTRQTTRGGHSSATGFRPAKLVSIDDVRSKTAASRTSSTRTHAGSAASYSSRTTVGSQSVQAGGRHGAKERSESLDSLFSSTSGSSAPAQTSGEGAHASVQQNSGAARNASNVYSRTTSATQRSLTVIKPTSYEQCEGITKALKEGNIVVLAFGATQPDLMKRVLDFSFGVASALSASVECAADKVFVISRGAALSTAERQALAKQGIL